MSDLRAAGLDPAHILGISLQAVGNGHSRSGRVAVLMTSGQVRICLPSRRAALGAAAMLIRVGYQVTRVGGLGRPDVLVAGWSTAGLEARLAAMRNVVHELDTRSLATANSAVERIRRPPSGARIVPEAEVLIEVRVQLRDWVSDRSGLQVPHDPAVLPADRGDALRLRAAWALETAIDRLVDRQVRVAEQALSRFRSLRRHIGDDLAHQIVLRHVSAGASRPEASLAQDSSAFIRRAARPPGPGQRLPGPELNGASRTGPARQAAVGFPYPITSVVAVSDAAAIQSARPGGRPFPATRPGLRR